MRLDPERANAALLLLPFAWGGLRLTGAAWLLVGAMGVFQLGIPYVLFIRGLRIVPATDAALITLVEPVLNPLWVWLRVGERPSGSTLAGAGLILAALLVRFARGRRCTGPHAASRQRLPTERRGRPLRRRIRLRLGRLAQGPGPPCRRPPPC